MIFGKHVNRYYFKYFHLLLIGVLSLFVVDVFQLKIPELYRMVINGIHDGSVEVNGVVKPFDMELLLGEICLPMILIIIVLVVGRFLWRVCLFGGAIKVSTDLRSRMFAHAKHLSAQYFQHNKVGNLMSLFTNDLETVQECFGDGVLMLFDALLLGTLSVVKMVGMNVYLTLFSLIPMAFLVVIGAIMDRFFMLKWKKRQEAFSALSDFSQESFSGIAVIKAFVKEFRELWNFRRLNKENEQANVEFTRISVMLHISVTLFVESVICIILGYGGYLVYNGSFNPGELIEFISYFTTIIWPVMAISQLVEMSARGKASLSRIGELLDAEVDVRDNENVTPLETKYGSVEFRTLSFRYPDQDFNALNNVSFKIEAGEKVGIIGKTGSGKTTIVDLILRIYNVPDGTLFVDGRDVNTVPIDDVRRICAYVPQDNFLFSDTIENNISFATDEKDMSKIVEAAKNAEVHENVADFSEGYSTVLGERGVTVSGGQKQRISIARALMKNAPILILDDSVSAVDTDTERRILFNLRECRRGKTTILIAHRVSTVRDMDKIIFLDDGCVVAVGTHDELLDSCPDYRTTVELQRLEDEREGE